VKIYHFCSNKFDKQANACYLMGAFMIIVLKQSAETVWEIFSPYHSQLIAFRDASYGDCTYECTVSTRELSFVDLPVFEGFGNRDISWVVSVQDLRPKGVRVL
jgi:hypothetical protein